MGLVEAWGGNAIGWFFAHLIEAFYNFFYAIFHPGLWLSWVPTINGAMETEQKEALMRFIYYGASVELFFVILSNKIQLFFNGIAYIFNTNKSLCL